MGLQTQTIIWPLQFEWVVLNKHLAPQVANSIRSRNDDRQFLEETAEMPDQAQPQQTQPQQGALDQRRQYETVPLQ